jgi:hypothetical protein
VLSSSFLLGIAGNPVVPPEATSQAQVELTSGIPFISDADLETALDDAGVPEDTARAVVDENTQARINGLRAALAVLALLSLVALGLASSIPTTQPSAAT